MRLRRNKKGWFGFFAAIALLVALISFGIATISDDFKLRDTYMGEEHLKILQADVIAQNDLFFLDQAARIAAIQSIHDTAANGGYDRSPCGDYFGYNSWQNIVAGDTGISMKDCTPQDINEGLTASMNKNLKEIASNKPELIKSGYDISIDASGDINGVSRSTMTYEITKDIINEETIQYGYSPEGIAIEGYPGSGVDVDTTVDLSTIISSKPSGFELETSGPCKGYNKGTVPFIAGGGISCKSGACCMQPILMEQMNKIKNKLPSGMIFVINSASRKTSRQIKGFKDHLAGGEVSCGAKDLSRIKRDEIKKKITSWLKDEKSITSTKSKSVTERAALTDEWLNTPDGLPFAEIINNPGQYVNCRHVLGYAVDINMGWKNSVENQKKVKQMREFMCNNGFTNYGGEYWHYEYGSSQNLAAKDRKKCYYGKIGGQNPLSGVVPDNDQRWA